MPVRDELILDASGDPVLSSASVSSMPVSSKPSGPGIVYSPEYKAQKLANALTSVPRLANEALSEAASAASKAAESLKGTKTSTTAPEVATSATSPIATPAKKPNYLLWAAIAVGGFFIVRRFLK